MSQSAGSNNSALSSLASLLPSFVHSNAASLAISATSLGIITLVAYAYNERKKARARCPIPMTCPEKCHSVVGHASVFAGNKISGMKYLLIDHADEDGLSCFFIFNSMAMGVTKTEHLKEIYQSTSHRIANTSADRHVMAMIGKHSLITTTGDEWKTNRHIVSKAFRWEYLQEMVSALNETGLLLANVLNKQVGKSITDILPIMKLATLDVIGKTAFGYHFGSLDSLLDESGQQSQSRSVQLADAFQFLNEDFRRRQFGEPLNPFAQIYWLPSPSNYKFKRCRGMWLDMLRDIIAARRAAVKAGNTSFKDMLNQLLDAHDDETNQKMNDATLMDNLITLLFAGFDTSSIGLTYMCYVAAKYPEVEKKCLAEIDRVLGDSDLPSYQDLTANLPYCNAVMQETLRLFPSVPITTRSVLKPITLSAETTSKPVTLPTGTRIVIPIWFINRDPRNFPNPEEFLPERFLPENVHNMGRYSYLPFSAGARDCVGRRFASLEMLAVFVIVLRRIRFRLTDPSFVVKPTTMGVVQVPEGGMPLVIERR
jgi:cytochrome P450